MGIMAVNVLKSFTTYRVTLYYVTLQERMTFRPIDISGDKSTLLQAEGLHITLILCAHMAIIVH